jgi:hypothetical protein
MLAPDWVDKEDIGIFFGVDNLSAVPSGFVL